MRLAYSGRGFLSRRVRGVRAIGFFRAAGGRGGLIPKKCLSAKLRAKQSGADAPLCFAL